MKVLLILFLLANTIVFSQTEDSIVFKDTLNGIVVESFTIDFGVVDKVPEELKIKFKYIGEIAVITKTLTTDPQFICDYPKEPLKKDGIYELTVCFWKHKHKGAFKKQSGIRLSFDKDVWFTFKGEIK